MNKAKIGLLGLLLPLAALLMGPMTPIERGGDRWSAIVDKVEEVRDGFLRKTVWRGVTYRTLRSRGMGIGGASDAANNVLSVSDKYVVFAGADGEPNKILREARATPPATFPDAIGFGAQAMVDCDWSTMHVLYIDDASFDGNGTFEWAWSKADSLPSREVKIIIPQITGGSNSTYDGPIADCTTYAGHKSPGLGFTQRAQGSFVNRWLRANGKTEDLVIWGMRTEGAPRDEDTSVDDITMDHVRDVYHRESTHLWGTESNLSTPALSDGDSVIRITHHRNFIAQPNALEPTAYQFANVDAENNPGEESWVGEVTITRSLIVDCNHRCPSMGIAQDSTIKEMRGIRHIGNMNYNGGREKTTPGGIVDIIDFYNKRGPDFDDRYDWSVGISCTRVNHTSVYAERIIGPRNSDPDRSFVGLIWSDTDEDSDGTVDSLHAEISGMYRSCRDPEGGGDPRDGASNHYTGEIFRDTAMTPPNIPAPRIDPTTLEDSLIGTSDADIKVGRHRSLQCDGTFVQAVDSALSALAQHVRDGTGISAYTEIDSAFVQARNDYDLGSGSACSDTDNDSLPDAAEQNFAGDLTTLTSMTADTDGDGWTDGWEILVQGTDPMSADSLDSGGGGGGSSGLTCTFGDQDQCRQVVVGDTKDSTKIVANPDGTRDTFNIKVPDFSQTTTSNHSCWLYKPDRTRFAHVIDSVMTSGVLDSAALADTLNAWGTNVQVSHIRNWDRCRPQ